MAEETRRLRRSSTQNHTQWPGAGSRLQWSSVFTGDAAAKLGFGRNVDRSNASIWCWPHSRCKGDNPEEDSQDKKQTLTAEKAYEILKRISDDDCNLLGFKPEFSRPDWFVLTVLLDSCINHCVPHSSATRCAALAMIRPIGPFVSACSKNCSVGVAGATATCAAIDHDGQHAARRG